MAAKSCERCDKPAVKGIKFCKECRKAVLMELRAAGYLETGGVGHKGQSRTAEHKECRYETVHGVGDGSLENAVRAMEGP